jgi:hypothetical protein
MSVVDRSFDHPMKLEERATMPLAGGLMQHGYQCGMLWGAALAAGAQAYQLLGPGPQAETEAVVATQRLVESFHTRNKNINCFEIIEMKWGASAQPGFIKQVLKFFIKGGPIRCFSMAARYAQASFNEINSMPSGKYFEASSQPVSCAALLAQKMGLSEMQTVMAAGLAGGIGLSGSACGALGAAIWITGMNTIQEGAGDNLYESKTFQSKAEDVIERFLKSTDYEFECSKIVGRKFENVSDHASHLRDGGCSELIEVLAAN